jgi:hypothetical protein
MQKKPRHAVAFFVERPSSIYRLMTLDTAGYDNP